MFNDVQILLVEDSKELNLLLTNSLRKEGFFADSAFTYETAISKLQEKSYSLLIFDIELNQQHTSFELIKWLANNNKQTKFILMSGNPDYRFNNTIQGKIFLEKPFSKKSFLKTVKSII